MSTISTDALDDFELDSLDEMFVDPHHSYNGVVSSGLVDEDGEDLWLDDDELETIAEHAHDTHLAPASDAYHHELSERCLCGPSLEVVERRSGDQFIYTHHLVGNGH